MSVIGFVSAVLGFIFGVITFVRKLITPDMFVGWTSTICILVFFFGLVLLTLGIIGEYIGNIVLSINGTPQFIVREKVNL